MTRFNNLILDFTGVLLACIGICAVGIFFAAHTAQANPSSFNRAQSAPATTTLSYMTAGLATTTVVFDTGEGNKFAENTATIAMQLTASSTATVLGWKIEYAEDPVSGINCKTNQAACDWYSEDIALATLATSTPSVRTFAEHTWLFASSTIGTGTAPQSRANKLVVITTPTRYVRMVAYLLPSSTPGAIWAEFVGKKENQ